MPQPLSHDLRVRCLQAYLDGATYEEVSKRFDVSVSALRELKALYDETGSVEPRPHGGGAPRRLSPEDMDALKRWVTAHSDWSAREFQARLEKERNVAVSESTILRAIRKLGWTRKKSPSTRPSSEHPPSGPHDSSSET